MLELRSSCLPSLPGLCGFLLSSVCPPTRQPPRSDLHRALTQNSPPRPPLLGGEDGNRSWCLVPTQQPQHLGQKAGLVSRHQARQPGFLRAGDLQHVTGGRTVLFSFSIEKARAGEGNQQRNKPEEETASHLLGQRAKQGLHGYTCGFKMSKRRATATARWEERMNGATNTSIRTEFLPT